MRRALAADIARSWLQKAAEEKTSRPLAARAATALLAYDDRTYWPIVYSTALLDDGLGKQIASACAVSRDDQAFLAEVDEQQLVEAYRWLAGLFPPEDDVFRQGAFFVQPHEEVREWRDHLIKQLAARGTTQAVSTLTKLSTEYPERLTILSGLLRARAGVFASAWSAPTPEKVAELLADAGRWLVRSETELGGLLLQVLSAIGEEFPLHGELLWDRLPQRVIPDEWELKQAWRPKPEAALQAYVAHELALRLVGRGLVVNREVLVKPTNAYGAGDRTDILVQAAVRHDLAQGPAPAAFTVVIEIKCPWNKDLMTDQRQQLAERYLPEAYSTTGIYLVGWYPPDLWTDRGDDRLGVARKLEPDQLISDLQEQAEDISTDTPVRTTALLLKIPRPYRQTTSRAPCIAPPAGCWVMMPRRWDERATCER